MSNNPNRSPEPILVSVRDAAHVLSVSAKTIYKLVDIGKLQSVKLGKSRRITAQSIRDLIKGG